MKKPKYAIVLGTRPEIIKLSSIIKELEKIKADHIIIHSGQHYSEEMDKIFFKQFNLPEPTYNLHVGSHSQGKQTGLIMDGVEKLFLKEKPDFVFVQGDTNTVLGASLAAAKLNILVIHVEAGLRSYDRLMPEEINRVLTDHISSYLFCPTNEAKNNLIKEGIKKNVFVVGNTIVDVLKENIKRIDIKQILKKFGVSSKKYVVLTIHRPENTDNIERLKEIFFALDEFIKEQDIEVIYPIHPRTEKVIKQNNIYLPNRIKVIPPSGYFEFLALEKEAKLLVTDSGGVQEEACILNTPCVTIRHSTERPETINLGANILVPADKNLILDACRKQIKNKASWIQPYGDGKTAKRILEIINN